MFKKMNIFSKTGMKLLKFLLDNSTRDFYEREISNESGISAGATNKIMRMFSDLSIVNKKKKGRMYFYSVDLDNPVTRQFKVLFNILEIQDLIERIKPLTNRIILFGSVAEGVDTEESDVDIFVLAKNRKAVLNKMRIIRGMGKRISPIIVEIHNLPVFKKQNTPLYERIERGIVLWDENGL